MDRRTLSPLLLLLLLSVVPRSASADHGALGPDKTAHFAISAAGGAGGYLVAALATPRPSHRLVTGAALGLLPGLSKEIYDESRGGRFSGEDLLFDAAGALTGALLAWAIDRLSEVPLAIRPLSIGASGAGIVVTLQR